MVMKLDRYIIREVGVFFSFSVLVLMSLVLIHQVLQMIELVIDKGVNLFDIAQIFLHLLPSFFLVTLPMASIFSSVMTFHRFSMDNEIVAIKSAGISPLRFISPVCLFAIIVGTLTLAMGLMSQPWGSTSFKSLALNLLKNNASVGLEAGKFNGTFSNIVIYVESMPTYTELKGVFIYDEREGNSPVYILAKTGSLIASPEIQSLQLHLENGSIHHKNNNPLEHQQIRFSSYDFKIDPPVSADPSLSGLPPLSYSEIMKKVDASRGQDIHSLRLLSGFYKNFSFPLASFIFGIIGVPLGIMAGRSGRLSGFAYALGMIILFYMLNIFGDYLLTLRAVSPLMAAVLPHLILIPFTVYLLITMNQESIPQPKVLS